MKKLIVVALWMISLTAMAQQEESIYGDRVKADVKMNYVYTLEDAITKAQRENKLIFFNCFADWAVPCHAMNQVVFSDQKFCDWMNQKFVNLFVDVTKGEGVALAQRYNVKSFAHYVILNKNGELVHRIVGGKQIPEFKSAIEMALNPKTQLTTLMARYRKGERSADLMKQYARALLLADEEDEFNLIKEEYVKRVGKKELFRRENTPILNRLIEDVNSPWYDFLIDNKAEFIKNQGEESVEKLILSYPIRFIFPYTMSSIDYDYNKILNVYNKVMRAQLSQESQQQFQLYYDLAKNRGEGKNDEYIQLVMERAHELGDAMWIGFDLSLRELSQLTPEQSKRISEYLTRRAGEVQGSARNRYLESVRVVDRTNGIDFQSGSFSDLLDKARKDNRPVFLDCYTSWCGPCKMMANNVFTIKEIGDFFNQNFYSAKIDMEKGEGIALGRKFEVKSYPTMLFFSPDGTVAYRIMGASNPLKFMEEAKLALDIVTYYADAKQKYESGDRDPQTVVHYFRLGAAKGEIDGVDEKIEQYFFSCNEKQRKSVDMWAVVENFVDDPSSKIGRYVCEHGADYAKTIPTERYDKKMERLFFPRLISLLDENGSSASVKALTDQIAATGASKMSSVTLFARLVRLYEAGQIDALVSLYENEVSKMTDVSGRVNVDLMLRYFVKKANADQKARMGTYAQSQADKHDPRAERHYAELLKQLQ